MRQLHAHSIPRLVSRIVAVIALAALAGCETAQKPDTGLYGTATHTGTLFSYRVPPNVESDDKGNVPRFASLLGSMDLQRFTDDQDRIRSDLQIGRAAPG